MPAKDALRDLLDRVAQSPLFRAPRARFEHVAPAARGLVLAALARSRHRRLWVVCDGLRQQEALHAEIANWFPKAIFLPEPEIAASANALPDPEIVAERLGVFHRLSGALFAEPSGKSDRRPDIILLTRAALDATAPSPDALAQATFRIRRGDRLDRDAFLQKLADAGYEKVGQTSLRGQVAVRGGIADFYSWHSPLPVRVEWFGDEVDSIRQFDPDDQTSVKTLDFCTVLLADSDLPEIPLRAYIGKDDLVAAFEPGVVQANIEILEGALSAGAEDFSGAFFDHGLGQFGAGDLIVQEARRAQLFAQIREWKDGGWDLFLFCNNEGESERLRELLAADHLDEYPAFVTGTLAAGFTFPDGKFAALSDSELFGRYRHGEGRRIARRLARESRRPPIDFSELAEGDLVVHLEHGIARFCGLHKAPAGGGQEVLVLEFAQEAKLYVPLEQAFLVSRYVGIGKRAPALGVLGDAAWGRARQKAEKAAFDYAARLLALHAERETAEGHAFAPDSKWQQEFEASFLYPPTPDQFRAIQETKADMESRRPMDRLICGDVGFGKTEVAIRAAFKAVMGGKQVAVLVPTTVLAQQHYQTFRERMSDYPVTVELLSRYRTPRQQKLTLAAMADGSADIVVGTHRLISKDVVFKNLGLVVVDEEQRFGVLHKEKFKDMFKLVDVLTLSATPIPRTLYLSLMGARDMSLIETPPANRIPVETTICAYDERVIRDAIARELARQGQVYFLHNRVSTIERVAARIADLVPGARVDIGHGQMAEGQLEDVMARFVAGDTDVLVSTTIIESGLDIPNANTIIIDRADRFGLADLYQLRGRVGRSTHKAYAYLMLPRELMAAGAARKRIHAIKQYGSLGAGFKIAMRDLEIRGAGNVLGTAQSGHIVAVGFELYCQLLKQAIAQLKGEKVKPRADVPIHLDFLVGNEPAYAGKPDPAAWAPSFLPQAYISDAQTRIQAYRALAEAPSPGAIAKIKASWRDRFGPLPAAAENLVAMAEIRILAAEKNVVRIEVKDGKLILTRGGDYLLIGGKFPRLEAADPSSRLPEIIRWLKSL